MKVVFCNDLSGKMPHRQVGVGTVVTSGSLGDEMVSTPSLNVRPAGSIPALDTIFSNFPTPTTIELYIYDADISKRRQLH